MKYILSKPITIHELGQRANQEDSLYPPEECLTDGQHFFILCDGMGGHESGEVASSTVCECMGGYLKEHLSAGEPFSNQMFENALAAAYDGLDSKDNPDEVKKMGTTMTFLMFHDSGVTAAHIGDSRIYQFRPGVEEPLFKSRDHSLVNDLILLGEITEEEARTSKNKNVITRAMQPGQENRAKADMTLLTDVKPGDWFYLCSDGMLEQMDDAVLGGILTDQSMTDDEKKDLLIRRTSSNRDNHTAFVIHVLDIKRDVSEGTVPMQGVKQATVNHNIPDADSMTGRGIPKWFYFVIALLACAFVFFYMYKSKTGTETPQAPTQENPASPVKNKPAKNRGTTGTKSNKHAEPKIIELISISIDRTTLTLVEGERASLYVTFNPSDATDKTTMWKSTDDKVATVDSNGNVVAVKAGSATITATCGDRNASCKVTVNPKIAPQYFNSNPTSGPADTGNTNGSQTSGESGGNTLIL